MVHHEAHAIIDQETSMIWKRKPYWSWGRWLHLVEAIGLVCFLTWAFGDPGLAWANAIGVVFGLVWEISNKWTPGEWQFADIVDFVFFVFGLAIADFVIIVLTGGFG